MNRFMQYICTQPPPLVSQILEEDVERQIRPEDDLIPFSDTPQISRFGPISRRIMCPQSVPTQSQAVIGDETKSTSVVRHSKHMSRPVPAAASLLHQNGNFFLILTHFNKLINFKVGCRFSRLQFHCHCIVHPSSPGFAILVSYWN